MHGVSRCELVGVSACELHLPQAHLTHACDYQTGKYFIKSGEVPFLATVSMREGPSVAHSENLLND